MTERGDRWQWMIDGLRTGEAEVLDAFVRRYGKSLEAVADRNIVTRMGRRFDAPEVVQSVCRTFLRRVEGGEFQLDDAESLWRLLCAITLTKVREKARYHLRQKRNLGREEELARPADEGEGQDGWARMPGDEPGPEEAAEFADTFRHLLEELDDEERILVDMRLQQKTSEEIAAALNCSDRTVRRLLNRLHDRFEEILGEG